MQLRTFDATVLGIADSEEQSGKFVPPPQRFHKDVWVDEDAYNDLIVAKAQLLKEFPFWGILGLTVVLVERQIGRASCRERV